MHHRRSKGEAPLDYGIVDNADQADDTKRADKKPHQ